MISIQKFNLLCFSTCMIILKKCFVHFSHWIFVMKSVSNYAENRGVFRQFHVINCVGIREKPGVHRDANFDSWVFDRSTDGCDTTK
jgi:hypothetical protein